MHYIILSNIHIQTTIQNIQTQQSILQTVTLIITKYEETVRENEKIKTEKEKSTEYITNK
jgi:hypothetical protein